MNWTPQEYERYVNRAGRLHSKEPQRVERKTLVVREEGEAESGKGATGRYRVEFDVWACRPCDWDNYRLKELQDCLVIAQLLPDDDWKTLEGIVRVHKATKRSEQRTVITIERTT